MKLLNLVDGKKSYIGGIGLLLVAGYFMTMMIMEKTQSAIAWGVIDKMFEHVLIPFFIGMLGIGLKHSQIKVDKKVDTVLKQTDRRESNMGINLERRGDDWS